MSDKMDFKPFGKEGGFGKKASIELCFLVA